GWGLGTGDWGLGTGDWGLGTGDWRLATGDWRLAKYVDSRFWEWSLSEQITFIGGGNMANSIIGGLVAKGFAPGRILACDPMQENLDKLAASYGVGVSTDNTLGAREAATL